MIFLYILGIFLGEFLIINSMMKYLDFGFRTKKEAIWHWFNGLLGIYLIVLGLGILLNFVAK